MSAETDPFSGALRKTLPCRRCDGRAERVAVGHGSNRMECPDCGARYLVSATGTVRGP